MGFPFTLPTTYDELEKLFGKFYWHDVDNDPGAAIIVDPRWTRSHIIAVKLSILPHPIYCHQLVAGNFAAALTAASAAAPGYAITSACSYVPRHKLHRRDKPLSMHSWGIAVDLNPRTNAYGAPGDMPPEFVAAFEAAGWKWGGRWKHPDPMHFQAAAGVL